MKKKKTILIIDDEVDFVELLTLHLRRKGYAVVSAHNGEEGLQKINAEAPNLVLLDINMPKMGGLEVYNKITTPFGRTKIPVVVFTTREELGETFKDIDADAFLAKPFEINDLFETIEHIFNKGTEPLVFLMDIKDNPHLKDIQDALTAERFTVVLLEDSASIKEKARERAPDFILMEYMQPNASFESVIAQIREQPRLAGVPILVYSYSGFTGIKEKLDRFQGVRYIGKPESAKTVISTIRTVQLEGKKK